MQKSCDASRSFLTAWPLRHHFRHQFHAKPFSSSSVGIPVVASSKSPPGPQTSHHSIHHSNGLNERYATHHNVLIRLTCTLPWLSSIDKPPPVSNNFPDFAFLPRQYEFAVHALRARPGQPVAVAIAAIHEKQQTVPRIQREPELCSDASHYRGVRSITCQSRRQVQSGTGCVFAAAKGSPCPITGGLPEEA